VRIECARKLTNQKKLHELALNHLDWQVRETAIAKIEDINIIKQTARNDPYNNRYVRSAAINLIDNNEQLIQCLEHEKNIFVRKKIVSRLRSKAVLIIIYQQDVVEGVRNAAKRRLIELGCSEVCDQCKGTGHISVESNDYTMSMLEEYHCFDSIWPVALPNTRREIHTCTRCRGRGKLLKI
jgi:hypothetical protein